MVSAMDQNKLRMLVFEKTGVKVDVDDPIFALVALNEVVVAESVERHVALIDEAARKLEKQVRQLERAGGVPRAATPATADDWEADGKAAPAAAAGAAAHARLPAQGLLLAGAAGIALLSALTVVGAQSLFSRPVAVPAPVAQAPAVLSAADRDRLARAEKLEHAIARLDSKTRNKLDAELNKP
jgi:hypothetical protein